MTDKDLSDWYKNKRAFMETCSQPCFAVIFSGDDVSGFGKVFGRWVHLESDVSMCDQSQSKGPLLFQWAVLLRLGVTVAVVAVLALVAASPYILTSVKREIIMFIIRLLRWIRETGGTDTTIGNSINVAFAFLYCLIVCILHRQDMSKMYEELLSLGFKTKMHFREDVTTMTFLKGVWYKTISAPVSPQRRTSSIDHVVDYDYFWAPLPSRVLKFGKSFTDPCQLYPEYCSRGRRVDSLKLAGAAFLSDVARGTMDFLPLPGLGLFYSRFIVVPRKRDYAAPHQVRAAAGHNHGPEGDHPDGLQEARTHSPFPAIWKGGNPWEDVVATAGPGIVWHGGGNDGGLWCTRVDRPAFLQFLSDRYEISPEEWTDFIDLAPTEAFTFWAHPVLHKLAIDYS